MTIFVKFGTAEGWCPRVSANGAGTKVRHLYVPVQSVSDEGIRPIINKLEQIETAGQHRIIRDVIDSDD